MLHINIFCSLIVIQVFSVGAITLQAINSNWESSTRSNIDSNVGEPEVKPSDPNWRLTSKEEKAVDCCPSNLTLWMPNFGIDTTGALVELYYDGKNKQTFYERSCQPGIENKPCQFMDNLQSRCVQQYSYSNALIQAYNQTRTSGTQQLPLPAKDKVIFDYIWVKSGCACYVREQS